MTYFIGRLCAIFVIYLLFRYCEGGKVSQYLKVWWETYNKTVVHSTFRKVDDSLKCYNNPWMHTSRFYAVLDPRHYNIEMEEGMSSLTAMNKMYVTDLKATFHNFKMGYLGGITLIIDFPMPLLTLDMGHWAELVLPIYSVLQQGDWKSCGSKGENTRIERVLLFNIGKKQMLDWHDSTLLLALHPGTDDGQDIKVLDMDDFMNLNKQLWMGFESVMVVTDRYTEPNRNGGFPSYDHGDAWKHQGSTRFIHPTWSGGFFNQKQGKQYREMAYESCEWPAPEPWIQGQVPKIPKKITWLFPDEGDKIGNLDEMLVMLDVLGRESGWKVRPMSMSKQAPFCSHLGVMAETGILIGRYSPLMASSIFMPPGSVVLELLPYNWEWQNVTALHYNLTRSIGDITHLAWRAVDSGYAVYGSAHDSLYKGWLLDECSIRECLHAHARASLRVDIPTVKKMLRWIIKAVTDGQMEQLQMLPWPKDDR